MAGFEPTSSTSQMWPSMPLAYIPIWEVFYRSLPLTSLVRGPGLEPGLRDYKSPRLPIDSTSHKKCVGRAVSITRISTGFHNFYRVSPQVFQFLSFIFFSAFIACLPTHQLSFQLSPVRIVEISVDNSLPLDEPPYLMVN